MSGEVTDASHEDGLLASRKVTSGAFHSRQPPPTPVFRLALGSAQPYRINIPQSSENPDCSAFYAAGELLAGWGTASLLGQAMRPVEVRPQTFGEEVANVVIHAVALLLIVVVAVIVWPLARADLNRVPMPAAVIYVSTMVLLYATSALYHGLPAGRAKRVFMKLDYCSIYLFIAGSYTPFALGVLSGHGGTPMLVVIWSLAGAGIALQVVDKFSHPFLTTGFYLAMGWVVLAVARPLFELLPTAGLAWLLAGGLCYTGGVAFFLVDNRVKFAHSIWHVFVLVGSACHFVTISWYA